MNMSFVGSIKRATRIHYGALYFKRREGLIIWPVPKWRVFCVTQSGILFGFPIAIIC